MLKVIVTGLILVILLIAAGLGSLGAPIPLALYIAFLVVGVGAMAVERRLERDAPVVGITFLSIGGLFGVYSMTQAIPQVNGWVIGPATLVAQIAAVIGLVKLYRVLAAGTTVAGRRRLAGRRGWQFANEIAVPVPGPRSAPRFTAVPTDAVTTTGRDVISAVVNGFTVTMFDRARPNDTNARVQSVWLVHLPMALPYLDFSATADVAASGWTDNAAFASTLMTPALRSEVARVTKVCWIENAYLCAVDNGGGRRGVDATEVERVIDALTSFAGRLPWAQLTPYGSRT